MASRLNLAIVLAFVYCVACAHSQLLGKLLDEKPADDEIKMVISSLQSDLENALVSEFIWLEPISYKKQIGAGVDYFIKALATEKSGSKLLIHLHVYEPNKGPLELLALKTDVDEEQPLDLLGKWVKKGKKSWNLFGKLKDEKPVDDEVLMVCGIVFKDVEKMAKIELKSLVPISYSKQTVAGINYFIKALATAKDGSKSKLQLNVFRPLQGHLELKAILDEE